MKTVPFYSLKYKLSRVVCFKKIGMSQRGENWGWKRWVVKEWEFWKTEKILLYQFFNWFNFAFMVCGWFPLRSGLKIEFVLFKTEKVTTHQDFEIPSASLSPSASKRTKSNFKPFLGGNWPQIIKAKLNQLQNWNNKIFSIFQNSHTLTTHPFSASIFTPLGHTNFFWNIPYVKAYTSRTKMAQFSLMVSKVKPNHPSWQGWSQTPFQTTYPHIL